VKHVLLLSGGIDSAAVLHYLTSKKKDILCIHYQYGQANDQSEKNAVEKLTTYYKVEYKILKMNFPMSLRNSELIGRNAYFIIAASSLNISPSIIYLGIHKGSLYYDCSNRFLKDIQNIINGYFSGTVQVEAPFIDYYKNDIINYCESNKIPIDMTYSCLIKNGPPCGKCIACIERGKYNETK